MILKVKHREEEERLRTTISFVKVLTGLSALLCLVDVAYHP